jgi:CheY-like chemotaxis protein
MDEGTRTQIFDPFFTTRRDTGGTGLGLSMVYGIVTQSEGHVEVRSEIGRGSAFDVHLPASTEPVTDDEEEPGSPSWRDDEATVERPLVALIEDGKDVRRVLGTALEQSGFRVRPFASGDEALAWSEVGLASLDAVVSDVVMPGTPGIEVARALRQRRPGLPIVLVSGDLSEHVRATVPPDVVFLQKPFRVDQLVAALREAIGRP